MGCEGNQVRVGPPAARMEAAMPLKLPETPATTTDLYI